MFHIQSRRRLSGFAPGRRRGLTLVEMTIAVMVIVFGLFLLGGWQGQLRDALKVELATRLLTELDKAMARYYRTNGCYPSAAGPNAPTYVIASLLDFEKTRPILEALPEAVWQKPGRTKLIDPWGTPLRFHEANSVSPYVKSNEGRPVWASAGPDGDFGDLDAASSGDNLRSDDPGPDGFRLHDVLHDTVSSEDD